MTLRHQALFYDGDEALHATLVPFVRDSVERDEAVLVNVDGNPAGSLLKALFGGAHRVEFFSTPTAARPASLLHDYKVRVDRLLRDGVSGLLTIGCVGHGESRVPWHEWLRYEAAVNRVFDGYPLKAVCPYDVRTTNPDVVNAMRLAHPHLLEGRVVVENRDHVDAGTLLAQPRFRPELDPIQLQQPTMHCEGVSDLRALRLELYPVGLFTGLPKKTVDDFIKAVVEVVANACAHGEGPVMVRLWAAHDKMVCTVTDQGMGIEDPLSGYSRSTLTHGGDIAHAGLGLWAARQLCDALDYSRTEQGFTVRLMTGHP